MQRIKNVLSEQSPLLCIGLLILPLLYSYYNSYFGIGLPNIWGEDYPYAFLTLVSLLGISVAWKTDRKSYLWGFILLIFYWIHAVGIKDLYWQEKFEYLALALLCVSFVYLVLKGTVRSFFFLTLVLISFFFYTKDFAFLLGITYIFFHFLLLVVRDNITVFTTLGRQKSFKFLGRAFLYWSPMLLFILPIHYAQNHIKKTLNTQIYTHTLVDSTQFLFHQELTDSLFNDLIPNKNKTTILFLEEKLDPVIAEVGEATLQMAPMKSIVINEIDEKQVLIDDTVAYDIITHVLPRYDSLQENYRSIYLNQVYSNTDDAADFEEDFDLITSLESKGQLPLPFVLVLEDLSFEKQDLAIKKLQPNLEISSTIALKRMELSMIEEIEREAGNIDFSSLDNLDKKGKEALEKQRAAFVEKINTHKQATLATVNKKIDEFLPEPFLIVESCKFWEIQKLIANEIKRNVNKRYVKEKEKLRAKVVGKVDATYKKIIDKVNFQFKGASEKLEELTENIDTEQLSSGTADLSELICTELKVVTDEAIGDLMNQYNLIFGGLFFYSLLGAIAFYFLVIQTFLYVFARISISKKNKLYASLNATGKPMPKGQIKKCGDTYTIAGSQKQVYFVSRKYEPSGRPPKFTIPFKGTSVYRRLKARAYTMNKIDMSRSTGSVQFRAIGSSEFVEWTLKKGEEVVFDYRNFVAISDKVTLKADVSL